MNIVSIYCKIINIVPARQLLWYGIVGVTQNGIGYILYLWMTWYGVGPKLAVTILFPLCVLLSFFGNKKITFKNTDSVSKTGIRFALLYVSGYIINMAGLAFFYEYLAYPHQLVQIVLVFVVAAYLFVMSKFFVFTQKIAPSGHVA